MDDSGNNAELAGPWYIESDSSGDEASAREPVVEGPWCIESDPSSDDSSAREPVVVDVKRAKIVENLANGSAVEVQGANLVVQTAAQLVANKNETVETKSTNCKDGSANQKTTVVQQTNKDQETMKELPVKKELPVVENESVNNPQKMLNDVEVKTVSPTNFNNRVPNLLDDGVCNTSESNIVLIEKSALDELNLRVKCLIGKLDNNLKTLISLVSQQNEKTNVTDKTKLKTILSETRIQAGMLMQLILQTAKYQSIGPKDPLIDDNDPSYGQVVFSLYFGLLIKIQDLLSKERYQQFWSILMIIHYRLQRLFSALLTKRSKMEKEFWGTFDESVLMLILQYHSKSPYSPEQIVTVWDGIRTFPYLLDFECLKDDIQIDVNEFVNIVEMCKTLGEMLEYTELKPVITSGDRC